MSHTKYEAGWVDSTPPAPVDDVDADQPTRIAPASLFAKMDFDPVDQALDATVIRSNRKATKQAPKTRTAEFLPPSGHRATGEVTLSWSPQSRFDMKTLRPRLVSLGKAVLSLRLIVLLVVLAGMAGVVVMEFVRSQDAKEARESHDASEIRPAAAGSRTERIEPIAGDGDVLPALETTHEKTEDTDRLEREQSSESTHTLRAAADALIDGQLDEALQIYRKLKDRSPHNESYSLAVEILSRSRKGRSK